MTSRAQDPVDLVATALAHAFLDGAWTAVDLVDRGEYDLGGQHRPWLLAVATDLVASYPSPPLDAPRQLAANVAARPEVRLAVEEGDGGGRPIRVRWMLPPTQAMRAEARHVPRLDTVEAVACFLGIDVPHLEWFADLRGMQRRAHREALHHYGSTWAPQRAAPRLLEAPKPRLRALQRRILHGILDAVPVHDLVHGFVPGRSVLTGARRHSRADVVIRLDLSAFFTTIGAGRVFSGYRALGYPEAVAQVLTGLGTHRSPVRVIAKMPPGGNADDRFHLRDRLRQAHLPQGAPTSPALANLCAGRLDRRLAGLAESLEATVTRYADDITISGGATLAAGSQRVLRCVERIIAEEGFRLNPAKTSVRGQGTRQIVTGIVVNDHPSIPRDELDRLKALLHNAVRFGPASQNRQSRPDFRAHLAGRVSWIEHVHPARGARLREILDQIQW